MKKMFTKNLFVYMLIALIITIGAIFVFQTVTCQWNNRTDSKNKLEAIEERLEHNDEQIAILTETLSENALAKTRSFADMLALDPSILKDGKNWKKLKKDLW